MRRIRLLLSYDGTEFHGFQIQPVARTVQKTLGEILSSLYGQPIAVVGCGRTDAGVHAKRYVAHFDAQGALPTDRLVHAARSLLPPDLVFHRADEVASTFHARFSATGKTYRYTLDCGAVPDVFSRRYTVHYPWLLDVKCMQRAAGHMVGTHDFTSFCSSHTTVEDKVRTVSGIEIHIEEPFLHFYVTGNGFLYNMVRIIVGTLLDVGRGKLSPSHIPSMFTARDRTATGRTMPPNGLALWDVYYGE